MTPPWFAAPLVVRRQARAWWTRHCRRALETHPLLQGRAYRRTLLQNCSLAEAAKHIGKYGVYISIIGYN